MFSFLRAHMWEGKGIEGETERIPRRFHCQFIAGYGVWSHNPGDAQPTKLPRHSWKGVVFN